MYHIMYDTAPLSPNDGTKTTVFDPRFYSDLATDERIVQPNGSLRLKTVDPAWGPTRGRERFNGNCVIDHARVCSRLQPLLER